MNTSKIRNVAIAAVAGIAFVAAGSIGAPSEAHANGKVAAALIGGALLGGFIASQTAPVYGAPVYYAPTCFWQTQKVWHPYGGYYTLQKVKVCQ